MLLLATTATQSATRQIPAYANTTTSSATNSSDSNTTNSLTQQQTKFLAPLSMACLIGIMIASFQITWTVWTSLTEYLRYGVCLKSDYSKKEIYNNSNNNQVNVN